MSDAQRNAVGREACHHVHKDFLTQWTEEMTRGDFVHNKFNCGNGSYIHGGYRVSGAAREPPDDHPLRLQDGVIEWQQRNPEQRLIVFPYLECRRYNGGEGLRFSDATGEPNPGRRAARNRYLTANNLNESWGQLLLRALENEWRDAPVEPLSPSGGMFERTDWDTPPQSEDGDIGAPASDDIGGDQEDNESGAQGPAAEPPRERTLEDILQDCASRDLDLMSDARDTLCAFGVAHLQTFNALSPVEATSLLQHLQRNLPETLAAHHFVARLRDWLPLGSHPRIDALACTSADEYAAKLVPVEQWHGQALDKLFGEAADKLHFRSGQSGREDKEKAAHFIQELFLRLDDSFLETPWTSEHSKLKYEGHDLAHNVTNNRQLKLVGPSNNGKSHLARMIAGLWVASGVKGGSWLQATIEMTTLREHLWTCREGGERAMEVWGPLRYLWHKAHAHVDARFALVLHEANRGGLFNALNALWWEKRREYSRHHDGTRGRLDSGPALDERRLRQEECHLPSNLALIFTENPGTDQYSVVGGDDALATRLTPECTVELTTGEPGVTHRGTLSFSTSRVGLHYARTKYNKPNAAAGYDKRLPLGDQLRHVDHRARGTPRSL
eukprot:CAMPEP_0206045198 /NCGR_PEP_ID=MMETSP1466-20131121/15276_1 /ASSEMBLY_ACC=CAM_ASM_001126 /TAXON_ID=44452 /ORGANISM="Pavlova gyrans, Strain CCMP608" /LENGTH=612 /DNA_ID=CAMNT_0053420129 /DNA_START=147 /DNA_END=1982 /DNA_ORIENTATION=+